MMSQISTFVDFTETQIFPSNKKINYLHIKGYFMAKNKSKLKLS